MCLTKKHWLPKISRKPIKCYKCVRYNSHYDKYYTEYMDVEFNFGDTIKSRISWRNGIFRKQLRGEVVHAYSEQTGDFIGGEEWMRQINQMRQNINIRYIECEIPPFTPYWYGKCGDIGAARIRTIKEV